MTEEFRQLRLGDVLATLPVSGTRQDAEPDGAAVPFVSANLVTSGIGSIRSLPEERTRLQSAKRLAADGDVLLVSRGLDRRTRVPAAIVRTGEAVAYSESLLLLRVDPAVADPDYVRLYLGSEQAASILAGVTTGTTMSYLRPEALMGVPLRLPALEAQRLVAHKLLAIEAELGRIQLASETLSKLASVAKEGLLSGTLRVQAPAERL